jgi:polysaccharide pyruvyl transferase CsaB
LVGYFGHGNAGDEWILDALLSALSPASCAVVLGPRFRSDKRVFPVPRGNLPALFHVLRRCRAVVYGGGELFQCGTSFRSFFYYLMFAWAARFFRRPLAAYGVSVDTALPPLLRRCLVQGLSNAALWCRDASSSAVLRGTGVSPTDVPDSAWARGPLSVSPPKTLQRVLWVFRFSSDPTEAKRWADHLNALASSTGWKQDFLSFHPAQDRAGLSRLRTHLTFFHREEKWNTPNEIIEVMARYDLVVSLRYHGLVAATLARRPVVGLATHDKVGRLTADLGCGLLKPDETADDWETVIREAFDRGPVPMGRRTEDARRGLADLSRWATQRATVRL